MNTRKPYKMTPLSQLIYDKGYTRKQLAEESGLSETTLTWLCRGRVKNPQLETIMMIARTLGVDYTEVVDRIL